MKKIVCLILSLLLLVPLFASCGKPGTPSGTPGTETADTSGSGTEAESTRPMHNVPESDFRGADCTILYPNWSGLELYYIVEEQTGDPMNDAVFRRQAYVEDTLKVNFSRVGIDNIKEIQPTVMTCVMSGDDAYQLVLSHCIAGNAALVTENCTRDIATLPVVDLDAEWWNRDLMDQLRLGEQYCFAVSDFVLPCPYACFVNRDIIDQFRMEEPYQLVYDGKWTLDRFLDMASSVVTDLNGDGDFNRADLGGIGISEPSRYVSFMVGCDQYLTSYDEELERIKIDCNTEKMQKIVEMLVGASSKQGVYWYDRDHYEPGQNVDDFTEGHILFSLDSISAVNDYSKMEFNLGLVPYPKFDENQAEYKTLDWGGLLSVPASIQDPVMVGSVLELLSYITAETVTPAYYDKLLGSRFARDLDMRNMIELLFDTVTHEVGGTYFGFSDGVKSLFYSTSNTILESNPNYASYYKKYAKAAENAIKQFYKELRKTGR